MYCVSVRKCLSVERRWCGHSELSISRISILFLYIWSLLCCLNVQYNQEYLIIQLSSDLCFTDYWGRRRKANGSILDCMILLGSVCGFFACFIKQSLEKCLQISLIMLYDGFVETGMRLLMVMEKNFH